MSGETGYVYNGTLYFKGSSNEEYKTINTYRTRGMEYTHYYEQFIVGEWSGWGAADTIPAESSNTTVAVEQTVSGYTVVGK